MFAKSSIFCALLAACTTLGANALSNGCTTPATLDNGVHTVNVNGTDREYIIRLPDNYDPTQPHNLVVALHWYGGTMNDVASDTPVKYGAGAYYGLVPVAGDSTIFVAPNGINKGWMNTNNMDLEFMDALVDTIDNSLCVDLTQRYAVGFSFGGSMAWAIANTRASTFRAVGILSGTDYTPWTGTPSPIPVFISHGVSDPANPITKGRSMRDHFLDVNGCVKPDTIPEPAVGSQSHIATVFDQCTSGKKVEFLAFDGVHQFSPLDANETTSYLPEAIWGFFTTA